MQSIQIDINALYEDTGTAKLADLRLYAEKVRKLAGDGNIVTLTGPGPVWLYLYISHALHGKVMALKYNSPVTGDVVIYDHSPF